MGLFDSITNMVSGALGESANGGTPGASDIMGMLQQHGFWMGNGQNLPVSPEQIQAALGSPAVEAMAAKFGIDPAQVSALIGQHLPAIVNQSTQAQDSNA
jgi:uncharacterized protein YidB (DUF937 family)